jgi:hypothetical protein
MRKRLVLGLLAAVGRISHSLAILPILEHIKNDPIISSASDNRHCHLGERIEQQRAESVS